MEHQARVRQKRDTGANWTASDPVLLDGEIIIVDTESGEVRLKIGDGVRTYTQLPFNDELLRAVFTGATPEKSGSRGLVPAPSIGEEDLFLRGDGEWAEIDNAQPDWSDIKNRPFGEEYYAVTWDGMPTGEPVTLDDLPWYKISDALPDPESVRDASVSIETAEAGTIRFAANPELADGLLRFMCSVPSQGDMYPMFIVYDGNGDGLSPGMYCVDLSVASTSLGVTITSTTAEWVSVKTIDPKYLPEGIGGGIDGGVSIGIVTDYVDGKVSADIGDPGTSIGNAIVNKVSDDIVDPNTLIGSAIGGVIDRAIDNRIDIAIGDKVASLEDLMSGKADKCVRVPIIIGADAWVTDDSVPDYRYHYDIPAEGVTENDTANVVIAPGSQANANMIELCATNETFDNIIRIWSKNVPESEIYAEYTIDQGRET